MEIVITPTAAILTQVKLMPGTRGHDPLVSNAPFPSLPASSKSSRAGMGDFYFLANPVWTSPKSRYPSLLPYMSHNGRMTAGDCEFQGKGGVFSEWYYSYFTYCTYIKGLVNCIQFFEMKNEDKGAPLYPTLVSKLQVTGHVILSLNNPRQHIQVRQT